MNQLIVGYGEIGRSVYETIFNGTRAAEHDNIYLKDPKHPKEPTPVVMMDILHVCFPYSENFVDQVKDYIKQFKPMHVIIWSTVQIGTTKQIPGAVHSPVEGRHPKLALSIRSMTRWIGANNPGEGEFFAKYFKEKQMKPRVIDNSDFTEFLKIRSTAKYGINLAWTDYEASVAKEIGMDFGYLQDFDSDYNKLYHNLGMDWAQRYILDPPKGKIGGHCVVPNAELLDEKFPSVLLKIIKEYK